MSIAASSSPVDALTLFFEVLSPCPSICGFFAAASNFAFCRRLEQCFRQFLKPDFRSASSSSNDVLCTCQLRRKLSRCFVMSVTGIMIGCPQFSGTSL
jgi:hypothetical protein